MRLRGLLHAPRDPGHLALEKGLRVAIVAPTVFAFLLEMVGSSQAAMFGAFASFALLGFADFGGAPGEKVRSYLVVAAIGAVLLSVGTLLSSSIVLAVAAMVVVGFAARFVGNLGGVYQAATSPVILSFVLGVTVPGDAGDVGPRVGGWLLAGVVATGAATLLWPRRQRRAVRRAAGQACGALAAVLEAHERSDDLRARADEAVGALRREATMATRPAGPGVHDAALSFVVDQVLRVATMCGVGAPAPELTMGPGAGGDATGATLAFAVATLRSSEQSLLDGDEIPDPAVLRRAREELRDEEVARVADRLAAGDDAADAVRDLDATFVVRAIGYLAVSIASNVAVLSGAPPLQEDPGLTIEAPHVGGTRRRLVATLRSHLVPTSPWFQDATRAGIALGLAVLVALLASVDHAFWVALGTLSVLRSNAFDTGRSAVEAALGTAVGFAVAAAVLAVVGLDRPSLWVVLVLAFFCSAYFPAVFGFVAGQAAFTVLVVALFNLIDPVGWRAGLVRIEDIVIGVTVSAFVALVFWPRHAEGGLRRALADLFHALAGAAEQPDPAHRQAVHDCAVRAEAAYADYLADTAGDPMSRHAWDVVLSSAATARNGLRFYEYDLGVMRDAACPETRRALEAAAAELGAEWAAMGEAITVGTNPRPGDWITVSDSTRGPVVACLAGHATDGAADAAARAAFAREWLVALTQLTAPAAAAIPTA